MQISVQDGLQRLNDTGKRFLELFHHGTLVLEIYQPVGADLQTPHDRDEVYIVINGTGEFKSGDTVSTFQQGDFLFVSAGMEHRFLSFSEDFLTWVIFYGPKGGENNIESLKNNKHEIRIST